MKRNIELKARIGNLSQGHRVAQSLGAPIEAVERQRDTYFRVNCGRLKLRERWSSPAATGLAAATAAIPLNGMEGIDQWRAESCQLIWYHRVNEAHARPSDYSIVELARGEVLHEQLAGAIGILVEVVKVRAIYWIDNVRIHLDNVLRLGGFLEFEAIVDEHSSEPAAWQKLKRLCELFQISPDNLVSESYSDLMAVVLAAESSRCVSTAGRAVGAH